MKAWRLFQTVQKFSHIKVHSILKASPIFCATSWNVGEREKWLEINTDKRLGPAEREFQCQRKGSGIYLNICMQNRQSPRARKSLRCMKMLPSQHLTHCSSNQLLAVSLSSSCHRKERGGEEKGLRRLMTCTVILWQWFSQNCSFSYGVINLSATII